MSKYRKISQQTQNIVIVWMFRLRFEEPNPQISLSEGLTAYSKITGRIENYGEGDEPI